ncbi:MAG: hypothetical protein HYT87_06100 [Nitrospirae bacterium]|nr:hypothetical protein [Nitrospirota bacterium]
MGKSLSAGRDAGRTLGLPGGQDVSDGGESALSNRYLKHAEQLHANFYEDFLKVRELRLQAEDLKTLVLKLRSLLNQNGAR